MENDLIIRTIASVQFPGVYLQMHSHRVAHLGAGRLSVGHGGGPLDQFKISPPPADGSPYVTAFESVVYPGVYLTMDGSGLTSSSPHGGGVKQQFGKSENGLFIIHQQPDDTITIESHAFKGVYLRLNMDSALKTTGVVNCQFGAGTSEKFRLEEPPNTIRLRVLSHNTHLMQDSFIEKATDEERPFTTTAYAVFEDEARRDVILRNVINSLADIVSLQEVWSYHWETDVADHLQAIYPYSIRGLYNFWTPGVGTSGLVLCSKFPLTDEFFQRFPDMPSWDYLSNKGVLGATATIPQAGRLRLGTAHTTGRIEDVQVIADQTVTFSPEARGIPVIMMGDFNVSWKKGEGNPEYEAMKKIFSFQQICRWPATDTWIDIHGDGLDPDPYTVKMTENKLHQLVSPERDTEPDTRLDYLWFKTDDYKTWTPVKASVPRGPEWEYTSDQWHWAHRSEVSRMPAAAASDDLLVVVSKDRSFLGENAHILTSIYDRKTRKWNHYDTGFDTTAPPGIIFYKSKFHLFHRDPGGNAIFHRSSSDGKIWTDIVYVGHDTGGSVFPILYRERIHLLYVDPGDDPRSLGGQIFCTVKNNDSDEWEPRNWGAYKGIGITTRSDISATVYNDKLYVVSKDNGNDDQSGGLMWSFIDYLGDNWKPDHCEDLTTSGSPGVIGVGNTLHLYYRDPQPHGNAIFHSAYEQGEWKVLNENTLHDSMIGGVCPFFFDQKLWLFYPYLNIENYYHPEKMIHTQMPEVQVDVSDHYPLLVDFERRSLMRAVVNIRGIGEGTFCEAEWAGTRGDARPLDGFRLFSKVPDLKFKYMGRVKDKDTDWKNDGEYIGTIGEQNFIQGFNIRLEGTAASSYELSYAAHIAKKGDTTVFKEGDFCGFENMAVEAMLILLRKK